MKHTTPYATYFILLCIAVCLWSCSAEQGEPTMAKEAALDAYGMEHTFSAAEVTEAQFPGFKTRAIEKLQDLSDYLEVISNTEYERSMRKQMMEQALALFTTKDAIVEMDASPLDQARAHTIRRLLKGTLNHEYGLVKIGLSDIVFIDGFVRTADGNYRGVIDYTQSVARVIADEISVDETKGKRATVIVMKVEKDFGGTSEMVWEVLIEEIK